MSEPVVSIRGHGAACLLGMALLPAAACAAADAAVACAQPALQEALRAKYPHASVSLRPREDAGTGARLDGACAVRAVDGALRRPMGVTVELRDAAGRGQARRVMFEVEARMAVWRLASAVTADSALRSDQLVPVDADAVADHDAIPAARLQPAEGWRLRQALPAGHVLRQADVVPANSVLRGDTVSLVYRSGALVVQVPGQALSAALPGEAVRVAVAGQREPVQGLLGDSRHVQVQP